MTYVCLVLSLAIEKTQKYKVSQKFFSFLKYFWDIMYFPWEILPVPTYITSFHIYFTDTAFCRSDCYGNVNGVQGEIFFNFTESERKEVRSKWE